jgi:hypothetical protein
MSPTRLAAVDELAQAFGCDEKIPSSHETEYRPLRHLEHVVPAQSAPNFFQLLDVLDRRHPRVIGAVQRADAGTEHDIGCDAVRRERMKHADLNGAETATASKGKSGFWLGSIARHGRQFQSPGIVGYHHRAFVIIPRRVAT